MTRLSCLHLELHLPRNALTPACPRCAALQALESALAEARREAAGLTALRDSLTAQAASGAEDRLAPLQAGAGSGSGGSLALAACLLPLVQLAYFGLRVLIWLAGFMEWLGFR